MLFTWKKYFCLLLLFCSCLTLSAQSDSGSVYLKLQPYRQNQSGPLILELYVNCGNAVLGSYSITLTYTPSVVSLDTLRAPSAVENMAGMGYPVVNNRSSNNLIIAGFDVTGSPPANNLHLLRIYWNVEARSNCAGEAVFEITECKLTSLEYEDVTPSLWEGTSIDFGSLSYNVSLSPGTISEGNGSYATANFSTHASNYCLPGDGVMLMGYTIGGTAINGTDYLRISGYVNVIIGYDIGFSINTDHPKGSFAIVPVRDNELEGDETVILTFLGDTASLVLEDYIPFPGGNGDVNGDRYFDIVDALMTARYYVGMDVPGYNAAAGDVDGNGVTDIVDALKIASAYVGL